MNDDEKMYKKKYLKYKMKYLSLQRGGLLSVLKKKYTNGDVYEGNLKDETPHGKGTMIYANRDIYEGNWEKGKPHGQGKMKYKQYDQNKKKYIDYAEYEGNWANGKKNGKGTMRYIDNMKNDKGWYLYVGNWKDDKQNGQGERSSSNGVYKGNFFEDQRHTLERYGPNNQFTRYSYSSFKSKFDETYTGGWEYDKKAQ